ncbi:disease resistance protein [Grosmannia clavigera kw1407]|uniref:Putative gamma-glutamylcyclotransferase n=1 Tax=Grosmannia clavigera (strain kw1407 / UAMH 11150) TaxID=655863 RepID=F0XIK1_GROCL|nr:disease resistance protein [Grosmannia clavigera kw1407]EFX02502.1 disease resistance protein [Grosmannia clavigera kw1407]
MAAASSAVAPVEDAATSYTGEYLSLGDSLSCGRCHQATTLTTSQMAPEVFFIVCYRSNPPPAALIREHTFQPAVLRGFCRHRVLNQDYPAIVADSSSSVRGMLVAGLTAANIHHLDVFEGSEYDRVSVQVQVDGQDAPVTAQVYVFKNAARLERREWDFDEFRREKMHSWTRADYTFTGE